jgi:hypothetical protein
VGSQGFANQERGEWKGNIVLRAVQCGKHRARPDVGRAASHHRAAAFVPVTAIIRSHAPRCGSGFRGRRCVMMASGHGGCHRGRLAEAMIRGGCGCQRALSDGPRGCDRNERARQQDQQQQFGGPANHVFRVQKRGEAPRSVTSPHNLVAFRDETEQQPCLRIGQFST